MTKPRNFGGNLIAIGKETKELIHERQVLTDMDQRKRIILCIIQMQQTILPVTKMQFHMQEDLQKVRDPMTSQDIIHKVIVLLILLPGTQDTQDLQNPPYMVPAVWDPGKDTGPQELGPVWMRKLLGMVIIPLSIPTKRVLRDIYTKRARRI